MEMPEGYKFIQQAIEEDELKNEDIAPAMCDALNLMKEIVEALEEIRAAIQTEASDRSLKYQ